LPPFEAVLAPERGVGIGVDEARRPGSGEHGRQFQMLGVLARSKPA
jgi:hypothetical protein